MLTMLRTFFPTTLDGRNRSVIRPSWMPRRWPTGWSRMPSRSTRRRRPASGRRPCGRWRAGCCCAPSTPSGATICMRWTILREGIGLRALAQRDPLVEYKNEGFNMFQEMMGSIQTDFVRYLFHLEIVREETGARTVAACQAARLLGRWRQQSGPELRRSRSGSPPDRSRWRTARPKPTKRRSRPRAPSVAPRSVGDQGRAQRSLSLRERQEIQEVLRSLILRQSIGSDVLRQLGYTSPA